MIGVVQHEVQAPRAARREEALESADARRIVQPQRRAVRIEHAQLAPGLAEQPLDRGLEALGTVESLVGRFIHLGGLRADIAASLPFGD
jgi:hypothetical protein